MVEGDQIFGLFKRKYFIDDPQFPGDSVIFTKEIINKKLYFFCAVQVDPCISQLKYKGSQKKSLPENTSCDQFSLACLLLDNCKNSSSNILSVKT